MKKSSSMGSRDAKGKAVNKPFLEPAVNAWTDMLVCSMRLVPYSERSDSSFLYFILRLVLGFF